MEVARYGVTETKDSPEALTWCGCQRSNRIRRVYAHEMRMGVLPSLGHWDLIQVKSPALYVEYINF